MASSRTMTSAHLDQYRAFAKYNTNFNRKLFEVVGQLTPEQRERDLGAFFGSVNATLNHILLADRVWLERLRESGHDFPALDEADLEFEIQALDQPATTDFTTLLHDRIATDQVIAAWVEDLTDAILAAPMRYQTRAGQTREHAVWVAVSHLFNHQTHHRGQVTTLLKQLGFDAGVTDFVVFTLA